MQEGTHVPQWLQLASSILAGIVSGIGIDKLYNTWLNRKKPSAEVHLTDATATEVTIRSHATAGDAITRFMDRLDRAQQTIDDLRIQHAKREGDLRAQIVEWRNKAEELDGQLIDSRDANGLLQTRLKMKQDDLDKAMGILKAKHISFSELDQPKDC